MCVSKAIVLKDASIEDNTLTGNPSVMGNLDRGYDVIYPGAFTRGKCLEQFGTEGFIADNHDWSKMIGYPIEAKEVGNKLYAKHVFHSTPDAQAIRQKCKERLDAGKSVGLSIGFAIGDDDYQMFPSGERLLAHAKSMGCDMSLFDQKTLKAHNGICRGIHTVPELYEYSVVSIPMNQEATALTVKAASALQRLATFKGEIFDDLEASATVSAVDRVLSKLGNYVWSQIRTAEADSAEAMAENVRAAFDEARDFTAVIIEALMGEADLDEIREDAHYYTYYYGLPAEERQAITVSERLAQLETVAKSTLALVTRRQETRIKAGRKLSNDTRQKLQSIHDDLQEHVDILSGLLDEPGEGQVGTQPDSDAEKRLSLRKSILQMEAQELLRSL